MAGVLSVLKIASDSLAAVAINDGVKYEKST